MKLKTTTWGHGETKAVFVHGFAGTSAAFSHLEPLLGDLFTAASVELPGHSGTEVASWDDTLEAVAEQLGERAVLIGYSQGARIALGVAARYPKKIDKLVLESCAPGLRRRHDRLMRRKADDALADLVLSRGVESFVSYWEKLPLFAGLRALPVVEQEAIRARRTAHTAEGLAGALRMLGQGAQPDLWPVLQGLRVPTLLLAGSEDEKYARITRKMSTELPLGWRAIFKGVGHAPHLECPERYAAEVRSFLAPRWLNEPQELAP
ncbi:MAG: 2-succinyl-6-hydroxy-2,4-cyclohexadiene-1-carboxylate synthase [Archangium gephyra]|uniref:Putative 2-succinyl-6-hydroxy-2,4-cyclohexadiene-1-carboxylate synthase n=1 Tax=Archangium gephyra TaxID=48 RepID=A0A2W5TKE3_9BACT|nr:MAG: 2-succinyl-6-hydroxy-2,4-cyclohexadiene-1-carboxylate synthase [Archangium gephyra]